MKANLTPTPQMLERMAEQTYIDCQITAAEAAATIMVEMAGHFGIGQKRMQDFWDKWITVYKPQWDERDKDETFREKLTEAVESLGFDASEMLYATENLKQALREEKKKRQPQVTMVEAAKMKQFLEGFKRIV